MHIELIGSTGAGKSTLANWIVQACRLNHIDVTLGDQLVLDAIGLGWLRGELFRTFFVDGAALIACVVTWRKNAPFYRFAFNQTMRLPKDVARFEKFNLMRNVLKKVGIAEIIRWRRARRSLIVVDEGMLHAAHNLFVHVSHEWKSQDLESFARIVQIPDLAIYVAQPDAVLIERTIRRGHNRIPDGTPASVARFTRRAVETFDALVRQLVALDRMAERDGDPHILVNPEHTDEQALDRILEIIRAGLVAVAPETLREEQRPTPQLARQLGQA